MSQASAGGGKRAEIERTLVQRSLEDEEFRQSCSRTQGRSSSRSWGRNCLRALGKGGRGECTEHLPGASQRLGGWRSGEISDRDLEAVAGGAADIWGSTDKTCVGQPCQ